MASYYDVNDILMQDEVNPSLSVAAFYLLVALV